ncbi:hypothetical protein MKW98_009684 [Papaver atlanticum]|uniref:Transcription repressor n=1 Tax=Papaver atlanticum TaxID=357466 RepID=A0AAD4XM44_9MAGN|nr:hypothetical protein MKW98_009684 [Papaver atlanticum]
MGNYKFRLSDMMPNAWFYKLKNGHPHPVKNKQKNLHHHHHYLIQTPPPPPTSSTPPYHHPTEKISHPRHSYYFTREIHIKPEANDQVLLDIHKAIQNSSPKNSKVSDLHYIAAAEPPRKSSKRSRPKNSRRKTVNKSVSSVSSSCNCRDTRQSSSSTWSSASKSDSTPAASPELDNDQECAESITVDANSVSMSMSMSSSTTSCSCRVSASTTDIIIDIIDSKKSSSAEKFDDEFDPITELELPPIITKVPTKFIQNKKKEQKSPRRRNSTSSKDVEGKNVHGSLSSKEQKSSRKSISAGSPGLKLRSNSPRILSRKIHSKDMTMTFLGAKPNKQRTTSATGTKKPAWISSSNLIPVVSSNVSDSFAVIKSSFDPHRDFRESMVEMIVENNLRKSGDLEELLACYLSLNSNEYHDIIVKVFQQIWFDLTDIH